MSELFSNAVTSIRLGIEDFETDDSDRMLSAARNYYAGLLLLAKECLIRAAPEAEPSQIIGARFKPIPNGDGGVEHVIEGYTTVDLSQLRSRFKDFGLTWPKTDIKKLQSYRNDLEHYHLKEPSSALSEAIASSFSMMVEFFGILGENPQELLDEVWETILEQKAAFDKIQADCLASWEAVQWKESVERLDLLACPECGSSLVAQLDRENTEHHEIMCKCFRCGNESNHEKSIEMVVEACFEVDAYLMAKEGMNSPINTCPSCGLDTYVETGDISFCYNCEESVSGTCARCGNGIDIHEYSPDHEELCSYCAYQWEKMRDE
ncbi:hypothetical protein K1W69_24605 [Hoeflea sp. WL0058]|uniref:Uncharacterized protein n=1 Tax=Flavimaribacter sediminis TaxID=2865987 RepID=A0AAE2ZT66_9HYPH|nr:hypothetical protein [Flavimaribacter sediminis]MBW8640396.1 hypothetical protein [Flavimaribacter sediminis]